VPLIQQLQPLQPIPQVRTLEQLEQAIAQGVPKVNLGVARLEFQVLPPAPLAQSAVVPKR
jgi:hypothetical protein